MYRKKVFPMLAAVMMIATVLGTSAKADPITSGQKHVYGQATQAATEDVSNNPYLASLTKRLNETYDTTKFKKNPPYKLALASQGPTNSWATLFDAHARWEVSKLGKGVVSDLLYADANGSADKQVPEV